MLDHPLSSPSNPAAPLRIVFILRGGGVLKRLNRRALIVANAYCLELKE